MEQPKHIYEVYIRATPERVWDAITSGDQTQADVISKLKEWMS